MSKVEDIKDKIIGQSIIGRSEFIDWVRGKYLDKDESREIPALKEIHRYRSMEEILSAIKDETGKDLDRLREDKGVYRQILMELLYRLGGLKGEDIGKVFGLGYTSVSQERKRLAKKMQKDNNLREIIIRIEKLCQH